MLYNVKEGESFNKISFWYGVNIFGGCQAIPKHFILMSSLCEELQLRVDKNKGFIYLSENITFQYSSLTRKK